jgi:GWxTD domain-containing protein
MNLKNLSIIATVLAVTSVTCAMSAQSAPATQQPAAQQTSPAPVPGTVQDNGKVVQTPPVEERPDPLKRRMSDRQALEQRKAVKAEMSKEYVKWLNEDVKWIISDEEVKAFKSLANDEERDSFIEEFWRRRNPNPESRENEFKDEHYARIAYANEHFAAGRPGWMTDRGHIYIAFGKPDSIDSHPSGGNYERPIEEGGGNTSTFPFEIWHYRYLEGIGENIDIEFVDSCMCNDYHATIDRSEKDALKHTPGAGQSLWESMGQAQQKDRYAGGLEQLPKGPMSEQNQSKQFDRLDQYARIMAPPPVKFADLDEWLTNSTILKGPPLLFDVRTDYVKLTNSTVMVPVTLQIRNGDITYNTKDGDSIGTVNILGRVSNINHRIIQTFEDTVKVETPSDLLERTKNNLSVYWKAVALPPGRYKIEIAVKDVNNPDHKGSWKRSVDVPKYDDDQLSSSSLILADQMERVATSSVGAGNFVIGNTKIRPRVPPTISTPVTFHRGQNLNFWMQVYNLGIGADTKKNDATIEYQILDLATNKQILDSSESASKLNPNADQLTLEKTMSLATLEPGRYQVTILVNDANKQQKIAQSAPFIVIQ